MKSALAAVTVILSIGGGLGAGVFGSTLLNEDNESTQVVPQKTTVVESESFDDYALRQADIAISDKYVALEMRFGTLETLVSEIETKNISLAKANTELKVKNAALKSAKSSAVEGLEAVPASDGSFDEAVAKAVEKKAAEDSARRTEEDSERIKKMMESAATRTIEKLTEQLSLDAVQQDNIKRILEDMNTKRGETITRGRAARENGEDFDWRVEMTAVSTEAKESIKAELGSAQLSTFNQLEEAGDLDISGFGGMRGGMGRGR